VRVSGTSDRAMPPPTPTQLVDGIAHGDEDALRGLYRAFGPLGYGLALRVTRDPHLAQDVVQEAFTDVWSGAASFDPGRSSVRAWVLMLVHRRAVDRVRREQSERSRGTVWVAQRHEREHDQVADVVELRAEHRRVRTALDGLSPLQREALELAYHGGLTHTEVAAHLDIPLGTAKTRIRDALRSLRTALEDDL
jgi:RNA polymerase sigma-70 factor (ECF subfamily)